MSTLSRDISDFLLDVIPGIKSDHFTFEYAEMVIRKFGPRSREFENMVTFCTDAYDFLDRAGKLRANFEDAILNLVNYYASGIIMADKSLSDILNDRQYNEAQDLEKTAIDITDAMEADRNRGSRDSRYDDRRRGSRDDDRRGGNRFGESSRNSRDYTRGRYEQDDRRSSRRNDRRDDRRGGYYNNDDRYDDRRSSNRSGYYEPSAAPYRPRREERSSAGGTYSRGGASALVAAHARHRREKEEQPEPTQGRYETRPQDHRHEEYRGRQQTQPPESRRPAYQQVTPENISTPSRWSRDEEPQGTSYNGPIPDGTRPLTASEMQQKIFDCDDINVIMALPITPKMKTAVREYVYEVDKVKPIWYVGNDGYRHIRYEPLTEEEKETVRRELHTSINVKNNKDPIKFHPQGEQIRNAMASTRINLNDVRRHREEDLARWEEEVAQIVAANAQIPEGEPQVELPTKPIEETLPKDRIIKLEKPIVGTSLNHIKFLANKEIARLMEGSSEVFRTHDQTFQVSALEYMPLYIANSVESAKGIMEKLKGYRINKELEIFDINEFHSQIHDNIDNIPVPLVAYLKKRVVEIINETFKYEMGDVLVMDKFDDILTMVTEIIELRGRDYVVKFGDVLNNKLRDFQFFDIGSPLEGNDPALDARTIYVVRRSNVMIVPVLMQDLGLTSGEASTKKKTFFIDNESSPTLSKNLNQMTMHSINKAFSRNFLLLADGEALEVRKDALTNRGIVINILNSEL